MASRLVSLDMLRKCEQNDKTEIMQIFQHSVQNCNASLITGTKSTLNCIVYDICWYAIHGKILVETAVSVLSDMIPLHKDLPSVIADVLVVLDLESQVADSHAIRERYLNILHVCAAKIVPESVIKERLEFETLGECGIIKVLKSTLTRFIKTKTRLFYKQQKFNLFREESEGYAKLITELNPVSGDEKKSVYVLEVVKSLIGCFNLDPNRVLDIILESFECRPELYEFFISLLRSFSCMPNTLSQVIGFKFSFYQQGSGEETPTSLYKVTALLLKGNLLKLNQLYGLLMPEDSQIVEKQKQELVEAHNYVKQLNTVSTAPVPEKPDANAKVPSKDEVSQLEEDNQKLGLCAALIDVGDWEHAEHLMSCFPDFYAVSHPHIAKKLCTLIHVLIDKLYTQYSFVVQLKPRTKIELESNFPVKQIQNFSELFSTVFPMVFALGPYLHIDPILMAKMIRLSKQWISQRGCMKTDTGVKAIISIIDEALLPSLSLLECNCCMAEEIWSLLQMFPYQQRYHLYSRWKTTSHISHPLLIKAKAESLKRLKYIMKRLSKDNVKPSGRQIGKLSHSNPGHLFDYVLSQIQTWDNLIVPVVDSLKYLTSLSYDVLAYCIIEALANPEKDRMKHDGTSISIWLQSLAAFGGAIFKKYPIDISGLLQYVANQLKSEKSLDLLILKEVVHKMAGIEASEEMTPEQVEAMTGGELLRAEGGYFNQLRNVKKSSQRLKDALLDQELAIPLCLLMAQQRQCILHHEQEQSHLKLVGKLYDQCQDTLVQFGSFLASNLNMEDYVKRIPPVSALLTDYYIQADAAFFLARPTLNHSIASRFEELKRQDKTLKLVNNPQHVQKYLETVQSVINPIVQSIVNVHLPKKNWLDLSPQFYVTFWSLTVYDLSVPTNSYEREIAKLKTISQSEENKDVNKKKKERERCDALIAKLQEEEKAQHEHCVRVMARLKSEKDTWFHHCKAAKNETITLFLQLCVFPRCVFTPVDAIYCAKFVYLIHYLKTANFSTLLCYDRIFCDITYTVATCSENEANRYGLFLCTMLETVMRWHSDRAIFDKECAYFPGFVTKFKAAQPTDLSQDHVDYENYRHVCHKWHFKITKALLKCLESGDFIQIRNALLVLIKMSPYFPIVTNLSQALERRIDKIRTDEKEKRPDIYALATGYSGILKSKKGNLIPENEFHLKESHRPNAAAMHIKTEPGVKVERRESENTAHRTDNLKQIKVEPKDTKSVASRPEASEKPISTINSSQSSAKARAVHKEVDHNGVDAGRSKVAPRTKEDSNSPMRRTEERATANSSDRSNSKEDKRERRADDHHEKSARIDKDNEAHAQRRPLDSSEGDREHKRRKTEVAASRSSDRETRSSSDKGKDDDKNGRQASSEKSYKESDSDKLKAKEAKNKASRKRDYNDENPGEPRRRRAKTDDDPESKRRDEYSSSRAEREDKRHHRSSSVTTVKKRSS